MELSESTNGALTTTILAGNIVDQLMATEDWNFTNHTRPERLVHICPRPV